MKRKNIPQEETRRQLKIKAAMNGKGLTVHAGLLPVITFMGNFSFRKRVQEAVNKEREPMLSIRLMMSCR